MSNTAKGVLIGIIAALWYVVVMQSTRLDNLEYAIFNLDREMKETQKQVLENTYGDCFKNCKLDFFYIPLMGWSDTEPEKYDECMQICLERG